MMQSTRSRTSLLENLVQLCRGHDWFEKYFNNIIQNAKTKIQEGWRTSLKLHPKSALNRFKDPDTGFLAAEKLGNKKRRVFALDCEMVLCKPRSKVEDGSPGESTLARVSLVECVNITGSPKRQLKKKDDNCEKLHKSGGVCISQEVEPDFQTVFDVYTRIDKKFVVVDYLSHVSGIEKHHLENNACLTFEEAQKMLLDNIEEDDIIMGHSLWSDFNALKLWHVNIIDTSFLFRVKGFPQMALSLRDISEEIFSGSEQGKKMLLHFQRDGEAHDSVMDAQWVAKVLFALIDNSLKSPVEDIQIPIMLDKLPRRLLSRLTASNIPIGTTEKMLENAFNSILVNLSELKMENASSTEEANAESASLFRVTPIKWKKRKDGSTIGTSTINFKNPTLAKVAFELLESASSGCGGSFESPPCYPTGWPGQRDSFMRKLISLPSDDAEDGESSNIQSGRCISGEDSIFKTVSSGKKRRRLKHQKQSTLKSCEIISYVTVKLGINKSVAIKRSSASKVFGPYGRRLLMIQQCSGTRIKMVNVFGSSTFHIEADCESKISQAVTMLKKAESGEYAYVK